MRGLRVCEASSRAARGAGVRMEPRLDARAREVRIRARGCAAQGRVQGRPADRPRALRAGEVMFEHKSEPMLSLTAFLGRVARSVLVGALVGAGSLGVGMAGYHGLEHLSW